MAVSEKTIAKILQLIPTHPTLGEMMAAHELRDVHTADILDAYRILENRGQVVNLGGTVRARYVTESREVVN